MPKIVTARGHFKYKEAGPYVAWLRGLAQNKGLTRASIKAQTEVDDSEVIAYVNQGRWVADCPTGCGGAMLLEPGEPFMCGECFNEDIEGRWRRVVFPRQRRAIERLLELRRPHNANWRPGETAEGLAQENRDHGLGGR